MPEMRISVESVLDTLVFLGALGVVPAIRGANEIARDAADALELRLTHFVAECDATVVRARDGEAVELLVRLSLDVRDVVLHLVRGDIRKTVYRDVDIVDNHAAFSFEFRRLRRDNMLSGFALSGEDYTTCSGQESIGNLYIVVLHRLIHRKILEKRYGNVDFSNDKRRLGHSGGAKIIHNNPPRMAVYSVDKPIRSLPVLG